MMHRLRHITFAILALLAITVSGAMAFVQVQGGNFLSVQTGSMVPALERGDVVVVTDVPARDLRTGDVITFINPQDNKTTITHRLTNVPSGIGMDQSFQTKGDANPAADRPIGASSIIGKVQFHIPYAGFLLDFMRTIPGLILLIYIPAAFVITKELQLLAKHYKRLQPYVLPVRASRIRQDSQHSAHGPMPKVVAGFSAFIVAAAMVVAPAYAGLSATATLQGTTIQTAHLGISDHVLIRRLDLRCGRTHTVEASQRPVITLYNPTTKNVAMGLWHISDNSGRMVTLPQGTVLKARHQYVITPFLRAASPYGIQFAGDRVTLHNADGMPIDGVSWGSDSSQLPTPLPALSLGTSIRRAPPRHDTNTATDWRIVTRVCQPSEQDTVQPATVDSFTIQEIGDAMPYNDMP